MRGRGRAGADIDHGGVTTTGSDARDVKLEHHDVAVKKKETKYEYFVGNKNKNNKRLAAHLSPRTATPSSCPWWWTEFPSPAESSCILCGSPYEATPLESLVEGAR